VRLREGGGLLVRLPGLGVIETRHRREHRERIRNEVLSRGRHKIETLALCAREKTPAR